MAALWRSFLARPEWLYLLGNLIMHELKSSDSVRPSSWQILMSLDLAGLSFHTAGKHAGGRGL